MCKKHNGEVFKDGYLKINGGVMILRVILGIFIVVSSGLLHAMNEFSEKSYALFENQSVTSSIRGGKVITPLGDYSCWFAAIEENNFEAVLQIVTSNYLWVNGENTIDACNAGGLTGLMIAVIAGHPELVELLLKYGANPNAEVGANFYYGGFRPLFFAAASHDNFKKAYKIIELLIKYGADKYCVFPSEVSAGSWGDEHQDMLGLLPVHFFTATVPYRCEGIWDVLLPCGTLSGDFSPEVFAMAFFGACHLFGRYLDAEEKVNPLVVNFFKKKIEEFGFTFEGTIDEDGKFLFLRDIKE